MINDVAKESGTGSKVKKVISLGVALLIDLGQCISHTSVQRRIMKLPTHVEDPLDHPVAEFGINLTSGELIKIVTHDFLILLACVIVAANSYNSEV